MTQELKQMIESGEFYSRFRKAIHNVEDGCLMIKWHGKYVSEIQTFVLDDLNSRGEYMLWIELYSDYGLGPRILVRESELEDFLEGKPLSDGSCLCGRGMSNWKTVTI